VRRPNPGRTLAAVGERLRDAGAAGSGALGRAWGWTADRARGAGGAISGRWAGLSIHARRRLVAGLGLLAVIVLLAVFAVPNLPCQAPGGESCPPADDAEELVPADALAYAHANLDPETEQFELATAIAGRVPVFGNQVAARALALLPGSGTGPLEFERDVRPWFGGEAAIVVIAGAGRPEQVELLEVSSPAGATEFAGSIAAGVPETESYQGVELEIDGRGLATAQLEGFLAIGRRDGVRAVIDAATGAGETGTLAADEEATEVRDQLPEHRLAEVYLSADGAERLIADDEGTVGSLSPLIEPAATTGAAVGLAATEDGLELAVRSALDPQRAEASPGFFAAFPEFEPRLPERLAADSLGYLGMGEPGTTVQALLSQASARAPGIAAGFEDLVESLRREGNVDIERQLLEAFGGEAAFALARQPTEAEAAAELPFLEFVADEVDEQAAREALAALQGPLAEAVSPGSDLQAPVFGEQSIDDVQARSLRLSPTVELTYAVFDGLAAIATDPAGIEQLVAGEGGLDEAELYDRATEGFDEQVSLRAFFDLAALVDLGEQLGLAEDPVYATFAGEFRRLEALALEVTSDDELLATDARLLVSESEPEGDDPEAIPPPSD
jgi:hypothetical protein